ncbi:MAG: NAD(P)H-hydrate dehydratase [Pseudomonadota bacterium]
MAFPDPHWLLTPAQTLAADAAFVAAGGDSWDLMQAASNAVADQLIQHHAPGPVLVLCGPGNNGADGLVAAAKLRTAGWPVRVCAWPEPIAAPNPKQEPDTDRGRALAAWGEAIPLATTPLPPASYIIDGLFGAGLNRDLDGDTAALVQAVNAHTAHVISIDMASGIDGATGAVRGNAITADQTITFFRPKPGHYLTPGRELTGNLSVVQIGLGPNHVARADQVIAINHPDCWRSEIPSVRHANHKYQRGRLWILGGPWMTGAAALAAGAGLRAGAGLVGVVAPSGAVPSLRGRERALLIAEANTVNQWAACLRKFKPDALVMGPGLGGLSGIEGFVGVGVKQCSKLVLDADALNSFEGNAMGLSKLLPAHAVLTPHVGEFARLFPDLHGSRIERAQQAARLIGAVIVLKGPDTIIAAASGACLINTRATPALATAGTGDVLAGIIGAYLARGAGAFAAAAAGVYQHGTAAIRADTGETGMIADDLLAHIPPL